MKIQWMSNSPLAATGYGIQTRLFVPLIKELGHDIKMLAFFGHEPYCTAVNWNGIEISGRGAHPYGLDVIVQHSRNMKADITISLVDAWIFDLEIIKMLNHWCPWFPVDSDPIPNMVLEKVRYAFARLVYSRFAEKQLQDRGLDCIYIPHGVDTNIFAPLTERGKARALIGNGKINENAFLVGMVAANKGFPGRKAWEENIAAFKMLRDKHDDAILFLQTMTGEGGGDCVNIKGFCEFIGLKPGRDVFFCDQYMNITTGFPDMYMVHLYNALDVLLSVSKGEGFGIPILEAQACGAPVITGDWTSMPEITFSGWKVDKKETTPEYNQFLFKWHKPNIGAIYDCLEAAYQMRGNEDYRKHARDGALKYDMRRVAQKYWKPALENIAERIQKIEELKASVAQPVPQSGPELEVKEISVD